MPVGKQKCFVQIFRLLGNIKNLKVFFISVNTCESISSPPFFFHPSFSSPPSGVQWEEGEGQGVLGGEESELSVAIKWFCFSVHSLLCCMTAN